MKRGAMILAVLALPLIAAAAVLAHQSFHEPGRDVAAPAVANKAEQLARGAYLARAGNCMACHTVKGGQPYAGGRQIQTPFGSIAAPNITPDPATGIGSWSANDFWRAIHNGKSRDGSFLYPAFPYPSYTKVTRGDADAMYAHLMSIAPVHRPNQPNQLRFPYNQRMLLAFWRALYFTPGEFTPVAGRSMQWNRGAYLVQGLGHCAACHTSRDALGGSLAPNDLAGGMIPGLNWYAAPLGGHPDSTEVATLLKTGVSARSAVFGPMAEVVGGSLQHLTWSDTQAMAGYLASLPAATPPHAKPAYAPPDPQAFLRLGERIYTRQCAECHMADGSGKPNAYPALAGKPSRMAGSPVNPVRMVLNGGYAPSTDDNPRPYGMPPYGHALDDREVAAVVSYLRTSWGNKGAPVSPAVVARLRGVPHD